MEHKFTESYKVNFEKLERRIFYAKYEGIRFYIRN